MYQFINFNFYLLDDRCKELTNSINKIGDLISDFIEEGNVDPYRYAEDKDGNEYLKDLKQVSFDNAINDLNEFKEITNYILCFIKQLYDEYKLGTYYGKISRQQIKMIALELPIYKMWKDDSFKDVKKKICNEYNISNSQLSKVITIIKNSRWLSYYIKYNRKDYTFEYNLIKEAILVNIDYQNDSSLISKDSNMKERLKQSQINYKKISQYINSLKINDVVSIFTYYRMGHELLQPEQYDEIKAEVETQFIDGMTEENISYFSTKISNSNFVNNLMNGIYSSGDYDLFIDLENFIQNETSYNCEDLLNLKAKLEDNGGQTYDK